MFDFRYHVASLAAVFLALLLGIVVGVGLSGRGLLRDTERRTYEAQIDQLERALAAAEERARSGDALRSYERQTYPALMEGRLAGRRVATVVVGAFEGAVADGIEDTLNDANGTIALRALKVPIRTGEVLRAVGGADDAPQTVEDLGRALARELLDGAETPLWDMIGPLLVLERGQGGEVDGVIVARTAEPQEGQTARFLAAFYSALSAAQVPVVGVVTTESEQAAVATYRQHGFSTVDNVDTLVGRLALAVVLEGGATGSYGVDEEVDALLPRVEPVQPFVG